MATNPVTTLLITVIDAVTGLPVTVVSGLGGLLSGVGGLLFPPKMMTSPSIQRNLVNASAMAAPMYQINYISITREAVSGSRLGALARIAGTHREVLTGDRYGRLAPGMYTAIFREALIGDRVGMKMAEFGNIREVVAGFQLAKNIQPQFISNTREVIGRDSSYKFQSITREVLGQSVGEFTSIAYEVRGVVEEAARRRPKALPIDTWSYTPVQTFVEQVAWRRNPYTPISMHTVVQVREQVSSQRPAVPPANVMSMLTARTVRQLVLRSRDIAYNPVSGVTVLAQREQAAQARNATPAPNTLRSPVLARTQVEMVALSRLDSLLRTKQLFELVAHSRIVTFPPMTVRTEVQQVAQHRETAPARSPLQAITTVEQIARLRETDGIVWSQLRASTLVQQLAAGRELPIWWSNLQALQVMQQLAMLRTPFVRPSDLYASTTMLQVAALRVPGELPYTPVDVAGLQEQLAVHLETAPPNAISSWDVLTLIEQVARFRPTVMTHSFTTVMQLQVQYTLGADYPPPDEVIGPEVGAQVKKMDVLVAQLRVVEPPSDVVKSRYVFQLAQQPAIVDAFPSKDTPYSDAIVHNVLMTPACVDEPWPDPLTAYSEAIVHSVLQSVAVVDEPWADPQVPLSDAIVSSLQEQLVVGEILANPQIPVSDVLVYSLASAVAAGDAQFPDPSLPVSEVRTQLVGAIPVVGDAVAFADPHQPTSEAQVQLLLQALVLRDKSLLSIPVRTDRRRAVVSIAIT